VTTTCRAVNFLSGISIGVVILVHEIDWELLFLMFRLLSVSPRGDFLCQVAVGLYSSELGSDAR
jgi:hypothetical protein